MTHNKYLTPSLSENNHFMSTKSVAQILSLSLRYTFLLLNFVITGLLNPLARTSFMADPYLSN